MFYNRRAGWTTLLRISTVERRSSIHLNKQRVSDATLFFFFFDVTTFQSTDGSIAPLSSIVCVISVVICGKLVTRCPAKTRSPAAPLETSRSLPWRRSFPNITEIPRQAFRSVLSLRETLASLYRFSLAGASDWSRGRQSRHRLYAHLAVMARLCELVGRSSHASDTAPWILPQKLCATFQLSQTYHHHPDTGWNW